MMKIRLVEEWDCNSKASALRFSVVPEKPISHRDHRVHRGRNWLPHIFTSPIMKAGKNMWSLLYLCVL